MLISMRRERYPGRDGDKVAGAVLDVNPSPSSTSGPSLAEGQLQTLASRSYIIEISVFVLTCNRLERKNTHMCGSV